MLKMETLLYRHKVEMGNLLNLSKRMGSRETIERQTRNVLTDMMGLLNFMRWRVKDAYEDKNYNLEERMWHEVRVLYESTKNSEFDPHFYAERLKVNKNIIANIKRNMTKGIIYD